MLDVEYILNIVFMIPALTKLIVYWKIYYIINIFHILQNNLRIHILMNGLYSILQITISQFFSNIKCHPVRIIVRYLFKQPWLFLRETVRNWITHRILIFLKLYCQITPQKDCPNINSYYSMEKYLFPHVFTNIIIVFKIHYTNKSLSVWHLKK